MPTSKPQVNAPTQGRTYKSTAPRAPCVFLYASWFGPNSFASQLGTKCGAGVRSTALVSWAVKLIALYFEYWKIDFCLYGGKSQFSVSGPQSARGDPPIEPAAGIPNSSAHVRRARAAAPPGPVPLSVLNCQEYRQPALPEREPSHQESEQAAGTVPVDFHLWDFKFSRESISEESALRLPPKTHPCVAIKTGMLQNLKAFCKVAFGMRRRDLMPRSAFASFARFLRICGWWSPNEPHCISQSIWKFGCADTRILGSDSFYKSVIYRKFGGRPLYLFTFNGVQRRYL